MEYKGHKFIRLSFDDIIDMNDPEKVKDISGYWLIETSREEVVCELVNINGTVYVGVGSNAGEKRYEFEAIYKIGRHKHSIDFVRENYEQGKVVIWFSQGKGQKRKGGRE